MHNPSPYHKCDMAERDAIPQCTATLQSGRRKGEACARATNGQEERCPIHGGRTAEKIASDAALQRAHDERMCAAYEVARVEAERQAARKAAQDAEMEAWLAQALGRAGLDGRPHVAVPGASGARCGPPRGGGGGGARAPGPAGCGMPLVTQHKHSAVRVAYSRQEAVQWICNV